MDFLKDEPSRRTFIERCALSAFGLTVLPHANAAANASGPGFGKAKRIIVLQLRGGVSHIDTFDPKRGDGKGPADPITTKADFQLTSYLPKTAAMADRVTVIRTMTAKIGVHKPAQYFMRTGFAERNTIKHPHLGAWADHYLGPSHKSLPSSACINRSPKYANGFFKTTYSPLPILDPKSGLQNIKADGGTPALQRKLSLADRLSADFTTEFPDPNVKAYGEFYDQTLRMLRSKDLSAFDLNQEKRSTRELYGEGKFGQGCLLARRLVESGVRFVEVAHDGWDVHKNLEADMNELCPVFDQAFTTLLSDLESRGMLDSTLVVVATEFGRKPKFDGNGRGHYPICFSTVLAGGGVKGGFVYGESDAAGAEGDKPVSIGDFHATIGWAAGFPLHKPAMTSTGRPFQVGGSKAKPIMEVFA
jgi:hypothetical protein